MREEDSNWFAKWEEQLPSPEELMPISVTLITPDLAKAFDIRNPNTPHHHHHHHLHHHHHHQQQQQQQPPPPPPPPPPPSQLQNTPSSQHNSSAEFDSSDLGGTGGGSGGAGAGSGGEEPARTLKRPRLVWTPQLHKRFVDAVAHLGIKNAVPKTIMQLMSVDGLTRENVASHLQKYRLYLKRMQGISNGGGTAAGLNGNATMAAAGGTDADHLFASSPVPAHFLHPGRSNSDHYLPFVPVTAMQHHPMAAVVGHHHHHSQLQQFRHFGTSPPNGQFEHPFLSRQSQQPQVQRMGTPVHNTSSVIPSYVEDMESATAASNGRKVLTLFPTGDD